jgi:hypothetical protein
MKLLPRLLLAFPLLFAASGLRAGQFVVFGEKDFYVLDAELPPRRARLEADRLAFFEGFKADLKREAPLEGALDLISPPEWGKTVSAATRGHLQVPPSFAGGFACRLSLESLLPDHDYILTLNGNPALRATTCSLCGAGQSAGAVLRLPDREDRRAGPLRRRASACSSSAGSTTSGAT